MLKGSCQSVVWSWRVLALLCSRFLVTVLYDAEGFLCCMMVKASSVVWPSRGLVSYPYWQGFWHCVVLMGCSFCIDSKGLSNGHQEVLDSIIHKSSCVVSSCCFILKVLVLFHLQEWLCHMFLKSSCVVVFLKSPCVILSSKVIVSCFAQGS